MKRAIFALLLVLVAVPSFAAEIAIYPSSGYDKMCIQATAGGSWNYMTARFYWNTNGYYGRRTTSGGAAVNGFFLLPSGTTYSNANCNNYATANNLNGVKSYPATAGVPNSPQGYTCFSPTDCPLPPPQPVGCTDGEKSGDELGVDCGGSCIAECQTLAKCDPGSTLFESISVGTGEYTYECRSEYSPDVAGQCKDGDSRTVSASAPDFIEVLGDCVKSYPASVFTGSAALVTAWDGSPESVPDSPETFEKGAFSSTEFVGPKVVTNNPDGTSTVTESKSLSVVNADKTTSTKTTTTTSTYSGADGTGDLLSKEVAETGEAGPESDPSNYGLGGGVEAGSGEVAEGTGDRFSDRFEQFRQAVIGSPVASAFDGVFSGPSGGGSPSASVNMGSYGSASFDLSVYSDALSLVGWFFVGAAMFRASRLIMANK